MTTLTQSNWSPKAPILVWINSDDNDFDLKQLEIENSDDDYFNKKWHKLEAFSITLGNASLWLLHQKATGPKEASIPILEKIQKTTLLALLYYRMESILIFLETMETKYTRTNNSAP